jgi:hypothetical protein
MRVFDFHHTGYRGSGFSRPGLDGPHCPTNGRGPLGMARRCKRGGGEGGGGSKVNMQAAMQMIPKPTQPKVDISQVPQIQQTQVRPDIQPGQGGNMSLAQSIMQFLQG